MIFFVINTYLYYFQIINLLEKLNFLLPLHVIVIDMLSNFQLILLLQPHLIVGMGL